MSNSLLNISMIANESLMELKNQLNFAASVNRQYDDQFAKKGAKIGSVMNIRLPVRFEVTDGVTMELQEVEDQYAPLTLDKRKHVAFQFSSQELTLSVDDFNDRYIKPAITSIANQINYDGTQQYLNIWNSVGTPGTAPTTMEYALAAGQKLDENGAPVDEKRSLVIPPYLQTKFLTAGLSLYNDQSELSKQYKKGRMGVAGGFTWKMDQNMPTHSTGAVAGSPAIDTDSTDDTLHLDGITGSITDCYKQGDVIQIASVYAVNPVTKQSTGSLMQFVVTADTDSSSGEIAALPISPAIVTSGPYQNVSAAPADGAAVTLFGHATNYASKTSPTGIAFHRDAFVLGMADLILPDEGAKAARAVDPDAGLSIRVVRQYNINNDVIPCRLDVLYGWKTVRPELACRIQG